LFLLQHRLLAALGEAEEERQHPGADEQELRRLRLDRHRAGDDAKDEQRRDRHHVEDHQALEQ
jgi:hypothetical protein